MNGSNLFILSGPSCSGKNTVFNLVQEMMSVKRVVTCTTRAPRKGEREAVDYYFKKEQEFLAMSKRGDFAEENIYDNCYYGTPKSEILNADQTIPLFLIIDTRGCEQILRQFPDATTIFIKVPIEELIRRFKIRSANTEVEISRRISEAKVELEKGKKYDFILENEEPNECARAICVIVSETMKKG